MRGPRAVELLPLAVFGAYTAAAAHLPAPAAGTTGQVLTAAVGSALVVAAVVPVALRAATRRAAGLAIGGAVLAVAGALLSSVPLAGCGRLALAMGVGLWLAGMVRRPAELLVLSACAALADAVSVAVGPTGSAAHAAPHALRAAGVRLPGWDGSADAWIGVVDVVLLVVFVAAARATGLRGRATAATCGIAVVAGAALAVGRHLLVPAITAAALGLWAANGDRLTRMARGT